MGQQIDLGTQDRRTSSSPSGRNASSAASGRAALAHTEPSPGVSPASKRIDRTLEVRGAAARVVARAMDSTVLAEPSSPTTGPTSSERLAVLAAQLPSVARDVYVVGNEVAKGGIGRVLRARDQRLDRPVAIKELLVWNESQEQRFVREALLTARLQHPAIVPIYEAGRWPDGEPFYAMKLVSGRSLAELIGERKTLAERLSLLPHVLTVAQAIAYAHSQRIIHRDLKPANVLVGEFGETVVIDWGLAKGLSENDVTLPGDFATISSEGLTIAGAVVGTPAYMPPEQAAGHAVDERADVYAIGAMLYHLLAAVPPYHDAPWEKLLSTISTQPPRAVEKHAPAISDELSAIVHKAMARAPEARYRTAKELADDLHRFQTGQIVAAHTYSARQLLQRFWRRNRSALSIAAGALSLVTLVVIGAFIKTDAERRFALMKQKEAQEASLAAETARLTAVAAGQQATSRADEMTMMQAQGALDRDPNEALAWLKTLSPSFTDAGEMRRIAADAHARGISRAYRGHTAHINSVMVLDGGKRFMTASDDKTVRIWDTLTAASIVLTGHTDEAWNLAVFPDGKRVASGSKDNTVRVWDAVTGKQLDQVRSPSPIRQITVRADGSLVGTSKVDGKPWMWTPGTPEMHILSEPSEEVAYSAFSEDGRKLIVQRPDGTAALIDVDTGARRPFGKGPLALGDWRLSADGSIATHAMKKEPPGYWEVETATFHALAVTGEHPVSCLSNDGKLLAVVTEEGAWIHETKSGALVRRLPIGDTGVRWLTFSDDGRRMAASGLDRIVTTWDLATGEKQTHAGIDGAVNEMVFLPDQRSVIAVSTNGDARLYEPMRVGTILTDHQGPTTGLALSADGRAASIDEKGRLIVSDLAGKTIAEHALSPGAHLHLFSSPDRRLFAAADLVWADPMGKRRAEASKAGPGAVVLGTFDSAKPTVISMTAAIRSLVWHPDGRAVFVGLVDGALRRVGLDGTITEIDHLPGQLMSVAVSPDGTQVAVGADDGTVRSTDLATGQHRDLGRHTDQVQALSFSPHGTWLASGSIDHTARLWRLADGSFRSFDLGGSGVVQLAFSPDAAILYSLSAGEHLLRRLATESGAALPPITGHQGALTSFSFSEDGRRMITRAQDRTARIVDVASGKGRSLRGHPDAVSGAELGAGDKVVVTLGYKGTVRAWPDDLPETIPGLRQWMEAATPDRVEHF